MRLHSTYIDEIALARIAAIAERGPVRMTRSEVLRTALRLGLDHLDGGAEKPTTTAKEAA